MNPDSNHQMTLPYPTALGGVCGRGFKSQNQLSVHVIY